MLLRLLRIAAVAGAVLVVPGSPSPEVAYAAPALPAPPPDCASTGPLLRYVTLFDAETPKRRAAREIRAACGTSVAYYPQIGVAVANLDRADFAARFGADRAYSAQAEALAAPQSTELSNPKRTTHPCCAPWRSNRTCPLADVRCPPSRWVRLRVRHIHGCSVCLRVAALLASSRPETRSYELATLLRQQADPLPCPGYDETGRADLDTNCATGNGFYGHGLVNALTAVNAQLGSVPDRTDR
ncbi:MAG TPA: hypothetical protein VF734_02285 [Pseudonocardiaceae bacterium]